MYNWVIKPVQANNLEKTLESVKDGWEVFAILPSADPNYLDGPVTGNYFLIVLRQSADSA
jgi:hypothetical protein